MIGVITPLVKGHRRFAMGALGLFWLGAVLTSAAMGLVAGLLGLAAQPLMPERGWWLLLAALGALLAAADLGLGGMRPPGFRRQTCSWWWWTLGPARAWLAWGAHLGAAVATIRATSLYWIVAACTVAVVPFAAAPAVMASYATGLAAGIAGVALVVRLAHPTSGGARPLLAARRPVQLAGAGVLLAFATAALALGVA